MIATLVDACGRDPGAFCELVYETTGSNTLLTRVVDQLLARPLAAVLLVVAGVAVIRLGRRAIDRFRVRYEREIHRRIARADALLDTDRGTRNETRRLQRLASVTQAARSGLALVVGVTTTLLVASLFVDLAPILAGAGVAGLIIGFGAQSLIADLLAGFSMLVEDAYGVGDWIDVDGRIGEVERVGLRTTSFRDIDGTVWHVPNGQLKGVGNLTQHWARATLDVPFALDSDIPHVRSVVREEADLLAADPDWADDVISEPEIWGVTAWGPEGCRLRLVIPTRPLRNWDVTRQMRERLKVRFELEGIRMPAPMLEVGGQATAGVPLRTTDDPQPTGDDGDGDEVVRGPMPYEPGERVATEYGRIGPGVADRG